MNKSIPRRQVGAFLFVSIFGTFLHFLFELTGESTLAGLFSAVNESIWEHLKLIFYPMVIVTLWQYRHWGQNFSGFWCVKTKGILLGLALIPVMYYTYSGIWGVNIDLINISIFFLSAGIVYYYETMLFLSDRSCAIPNWLAIGVLMGIALIFTLFTFFPPRIPLFEDPLTKTYGIFRK